VAPTRGLLTNRPGICYDDGIDRFRGLAVVFAMDPTIETRIARDVEKHLARLLVRSPKLSELPITPLFGANDLIRLELALKRFAQVHTSERSKRLIEAVGTILSVARTRLRMANAGRRALVVDDTSPRQ
jgi:hypothetical protein